MFQKPCTLTSTRPTLSVEILPEKGKFGIPANKTRSDLAIHREAHSDQPTRALAHSTFPRTERVLLNSDTPLIVFENVMLLSDAEAESAQRDDGVLMLSPGTEK